MVAPTQTANNKDIKASLFSEKNSISEPLLSKKYIKPNSYISLETPKSDYTTLNDDIENVNSTKKSTYVSAENLTLLNVSDNLDSDIKVGLVQEAIYIGNTKI